jgi:hypothetical protein
MKRPPECRAAHRAQKLIDLKCTPPRYSATCSKTAGCRESIMRFHWRNKKFVTARTQESLKSLIPLQLPPTPIWVLAVVVEHPLDVTVQRPQHADPRMHQEVAPKADRADAGGVLLLSKRAFSRTFRPEGPPSPFRQLSRTQGDRDESCQGVGVSFLNYRFNAW